MTQPNPAAAARAAEMYLLFQTPMSLEQVGLRFGVSRQRVQQILTQFGYPTRNLRPALVICKMCGEAYPHGAYEAHRAAAGHKFMKPVTRMPQAQIDAVVADYLAGMRGQDIADKHGLGYQEHVYRVLKLAGIEPDRGGGRYVRTPELRAVATARIKKAHTEWLAKQYTSSDASPTRPSATAEPDPQVQAAAGPHL